MHWLHGSQAHQGLDPTGVSDNKRGATELMDKGQPWSVKGIDPDTRQAAKMAARRAGLTVGAWLNRVIQRAAAEELGLAAPAETTGQAYPGPPHPSQPHPGQPHPGQPHTAGLQGGHPGFPAPAGPYAGNATAGMMQPQAYAQGAGLTEAAQAAQPIAGQQPAGQQFPGQQFPGQPMQAQALDTLLDALRRQTEEVKAAIRNSTEELRYNTDKIQPMADRLRPMSERLESIADKLEHVGEVDRRLDEAERKAERAALQVTPLERTLTRLFERMENDDQLPYPGPEMRYRRRGLFGRLFGD
ncbi:hypothetical protein ACFOGJ_28195 [Marinibaculum pumilum]|uniref:LTXXQ motif family protein n=1 Tax=Marinibaculum pumilum TaxID=1766165 RepID=A0ABV7L967_9PROT